MYSSSISKVDAIKKRSKSTSNSHLTRISKKSSIESKLLLPHNLQKNQNGNSKSTTGLDLLLNQNNEQKAVPEKRDAITQDTFDRVFAGKFANLPKPQSKLVRVFTSSTFTDTTVERNALMEDIYPKLKEYCRETYGLDFQVVDMRWGVRDESTDDHMTTKLCLSEIANCQRLSVGANFVVFLCQKYGYRPIPSEILSTELELLKRTLREEHEDISLLDSWYIEDTNSVPPMFVLQQISSILVNFNNKRIPKLQEQDAKQWWECEAKMQQMLRKGARSCYEKGLLDHEAMHNYFMSVTEREVVHGILKAKNPNEHCLCYIRHINNIALSQMKTASKFVDIAHNHVNSEAQKLLANLRDERVPAKLAMQNIRRSTVEWVGRDGIDVQYHAEYIRQFCSDFYNSITTMVDNAMAKHEKYRDQLFTEVLTHLTTGSTVSDMFFGRDEQLNCAKQYVLGNSNLPIILQGENGCGKTSLMAKIAKEIRNWYDNTCEPVVLLRFLGTSPDSSNIAPLLTSVCNQIALNYDESLNNSAPTELSKLFQHFKKITYLATRERPLVIIFDSLDLLSTIDGAHELLWFPPSLPPFVKLFASLTPGASLIYSKMLRLIEDKRQYLTVPSLGKELGNDVVKKWLSDKGRTLSERQWNTVSKALDKCTLPLFVKLIFAAVARWKSYSRPQETILFSSLQESINVLFHRTESQHGKLLVSHALSYISAARSGISDSEVEDLISLDDKVLDDIYQYHLPPVRRIPPLLWSRIRSDLPGYLSERAADGVIVLNWYHQQFRQVAIERYFKNVNHLETCHSAMAEYFLGVWGGVPKPYQYTEMQKQRFGVTENEGLADRKVPKQPNVFSSKDGNHRYNTRKLSELPYHLLRSGRVDELLSLCLFDYEFLHAKVSSFPLQSLIADYEDAIQNVRDVEILRQLTLAVDALRLSASILSRNPSMLAFELLGRLLPLVATNKHVSKLLIKCDREGPQHNAFVPAHHCFHAPGGPLKFSLEEHQFAVFGMQLTSDRKLLVSTSTQIIVWDVATGDIARVVNPNIDGVFFGLAVSENDKFAAAYTNNNQIIVASLVTGEFTAIDPEPFVTQMELQAIRFVGNNNILMWSKSQYLIYTVNGNIVSQGSESEGDNNHIIHIFYRDKLNMMFLLWTGERDEWRLVVKGTLNDDKTQSKGKISNFYCEASITFLDNHFRKGFACIAHKSCLDPDGDHNFALVRITLSESKYITEEVIQEGLLNRINDIKIFERNCSSPNQNPWIVGVMIDSFLLYRDNCDFKPIFLKLPLNVRNIPIRPRHTTTAVTFASHDTVFVAGVRKHLFLWNVSSTELLRSLDAHFGRILNLDSVSQLGQNILISSSLDHTIKIWNMENIFEKSFSVSTMEQSIEKISVAKDNPTLAAVQTRKNIGIWDIKSHRYIASLVANVHGAVVSNSLLASDGRTIVAIESDQLLLWDLRTQSVIHSIHAPNVFQIFYMNKEALIGVIYRQVDSAEQKIARLTIYRVVDFSVQYNFEYPCRLFKDCAVLRDQVTGVVITLFKGHDSLLVFDAVEKTQKIKFRPRQSKKQKDVMISKIIAMPSNSNQVIVVESDNKASVWDIRVRKFHRTLTQFNGVVSSDGRLGLFAPAKGGLFVIDMRSGQVAKTLIGNVTEGVNDVTCSFSPNGQYVFYYHSGHKTLRVFRVLDCQLIGTFRPHATITCWSYDPDGFFVIIGAQDGSLLTVVLNDPIAKEETLNKIAILPCRRHLAEYLHIHVPEEAELDTFDLRNLGAVTAAVTRFKSLLENKKGGGVSKKSHVCSLM
ncbi:hypothetical protein L3Y34_008385 [Caenorhabditis briggsae]|uniref:NACHT domain-containing protein n=1 Tax=Caenorhabditis briggsae TaxID=6238 RepID=A0AAE9A6N3_CAEBR|nr:hypothetical protein L3Y34_008385 [Caenorhabditis briggsae]